MPLRLPCLHGAPQQHRALAQGAAHGQGVEGEALAAGLHDALPRRLREAQRADLQGGHLVNALVVRHLASKSRSDDVFDKSI